MALEHIVHNIVILRMFKVNRRAIEEARHMIKHVPPPALRAQPAAQ